MHKDRIESFVFECCEGRQALEKLAAKLTKARDAKRAEAERTIAKLPRSMQAQTRSDMLRGVERETFEEVKDAYWEARRKYEAQREQLQSAAKFWSDPKAVLDRSTISDPARMAATINLQNASPAAIKGFIDHAVSERNAPVAAALLQVLERLPAHQRPITTNELAKAVEPEYASKIRDKLRTAELNQLYAQTAVDAIQPLQGTWRIERGLRLRELGVKDGDPSPPARPAPSATEEARTSREKISAGITAREGGAA